MVGLRHCLRADLKHVGFTLQKLQEIADGYSWDDPTSSVLSRLPKDTLSSGTGGDYGPVASLQRTHRSLTSAPRLIPLPLPESYFSTHAILGSPKAGKPPHRVSSGVEEVEESRSSARAFF